MLVSYGWFTVCREVANLMYAIISQGFKEHVEQHHNMWAYIYYSLYLDQIDTSDHNAIEKYIYEKVRPRILQP